MRKWKRLSSNKKRIVTEQKGKICSYPNCFLKSKVKGLCLNHYVQKRENRKRTSEINIGKKCSADGCNEDAKSKGMCYNHYGQKRYWDKKNDKRKTKR